jgi:hypothetical protein
MVPSQPYLLTGLRQCEATTAALLVLHVIARPATKSEFRDALCLPWGTRKLVWGYLCTYQAKAVVGPLRVQVVLVRFEFGFATLFMAGAMTADWSRKVDDVYQPACGLCNAVFHTQRYEQEMRPGKADPYETYFIPRRFDRLLPSPIPDICVT